MKGAKDDDGFDRATNFLQGSKGFTGGEFIDVEGTNDTFKSMPIILMTNAKEITPTDGAPTFSITAGKSVKKTTKSGAKGKKRTGGKKKADSKKKADTKTKAGSKTARTKKRAGTKKSAQNSSAKKSTKTKKRSRAAKK
jgi:hypothetical protein